MILIKKLFASTLLVLLFNQLWSQKSDYDTLKFEPVVLEQSKEIHKTLKKAFKRCLREYDNSYIVMIKSDSGSYFERGMIGVYPCLNELYCFWSCHCGNPIYRYNYNGIDIYIFDMTATKQTKQCSREYYYECLSDHIAICDLSFYFLKNDKKCTSERYYFGEILIDW